MRAGFLQTRKFFFGSSSSSPADKINSFSRFYFLFFIFSVTVVVFHAIITLVAAVDVSSYHTRQSDVHLTAAVLNFAINLFSFITITLM